MIGYSVHGCPRPVGSTLRQRTVWAPGRRSADDHPVMWVVSVVDAPGGQTFEARFHLDPSVIVATELHHHTSGAPEVLAEAARLLEAGDGWQTLTVQPCQVEGCGNPLPMWRSGREARNEPRECLSCEARSVLACAECGMPDDVRYNGRERLLRDQVCFGCALWRDRVAKGCQVVSQDWRAYGIRRGSQGPASCKGFGGAEWVIRFHDGRVVETDDLWDGGEVPEWFRDRISRNAEVHSKLSEAGKALLAEEAGR